MPVKKVAWIEKNEDGDDLVCLARVKLASDGSIVETEIVKRNRDFIAPDIKIGKLTEEE